MLDKVRDYLFGDPDEQTHVDLFLSRSNIDLMYRNFEAVCRRHGMETLCKTRDEIRTEMSVWALTDTDVAVFYSPDLTVDYMNKKFTQTLFDMDPTRIDKNMSNYLADDMKNLDLWTENHTFTDATRQKTKLKGISNPHVVGAHRRHYSRDDGGLRSHEKGPTRTRGYDMSGL